MGKVFLFISTSLLAWWHRKNIEAIKTLLITLGNDFSARRAAAMTTIRRATFSIAHGTYWKLNAFLLFAFFLIFVIIYFVSWFFFVGFPPSLDGGVAARYFDRFHYSLFVAINRTNELSEGLLRRNLLGNSYPWPRGGFTLAFLKSTLRGGSSKSDSVLSLEVNTTDMFQSIISTNEITMPINI